MVSAEEGNKEWTGAAEATEGIEPTGAAEATEGIKPTGAAKVKEEVASTGAAKEPTQDLCATTTI